MRTSAADMIPTRIKLTNKNMKIVKFALLDISKLPLHYLTHNKEPPVKTGGILGFRLPPVRLWRMFPSTS